MLSPRRKIFLAALTGVSIAAVAAAFFLSSGALKEWRARRYAERAAALARGGAADAARTACFRALALDRNCLPATRQLLALLPGSDVKNAVLLRARIADLAPADHANLEQLASLAVAANRPDIAAKAIRDLEHAEGATARVLALRANLALARGDHVTALAAFHEALERDPQNIATRLSAALAAVQSGSTTGATERELTELRANESTRLEALRGLREIALRKSDRAQAIQYSAAVARLPRSDFADWLLRADLVADETPGRLDELLPGLTAKAGKDARALNSIASWLRKHGGADKIEPWLASCEALERDPTTVQMIRADDFMARGAWTELDSLLAGQNWGGMDFVRKAAVARAARARGESDASVKQWRDASDASLTTLATTRMLAELTAGWPEWGEQADAFLWRAAEHGPDYAVWALPQLQHRATEQRDTLALLRVAKAMQRLEPNSDPVRNNLAFYSLLLNASTASANQIAEDLSSKYPQDPAIASTYALSLLLRERPSDALAALERLPATVRESGQIAPYYALAVAGAGNTQRANEVLAHVHRERLLPEEEALLRRAKL